jgi:hypothetical protein
MIVVIMIFRSKWRDLAEEEWGPLAPQPPLQGGEQGVRGEIVSLFWKKCIEKRFLSSPHTP